MKISLVNLFSILFVISLVSSVILPAYAEVTSFQTNAGFYKGGNQIVFSGKTAPGDSQNVYIVIYGPDNFALLASGTTDNANNFQWLILALQIIKKTFQLREFTMLLHSL